MARKTSNGTLTMIHSFQNEYNSTKLVYFQSQSSLDCYQWTIDLAYYRTCKPGQRIFELIHNIIKSHYSLVKKTHTHTTNKGWCDLCFVSNSSNPIKTIIIDITAIHPSTTCGWRMKWFIHLNSYIYTCGCGSLSTRPFRGITSLRL